MRKSWELFKLNLSLWSLTNYDLEVINGIIHGSLYFIIGRKARTSPLYKAKYLNTIQNKSWWKSKRNPDQNLPLRQTRRGVPYNQIGSPLVLGGESGTRKFSEQTFARELKLSGLSQLSTFIAFFAHLSFCIMHPDCDRPFGFYESSKVFQPARAELKCEVLLPYLAAEWTI